MSRTLSVVEYGGTLSVTNRFNTHHKSAVMARFADVGDWSAWLAEGDEPEHLAVIRLNIDKGILYGGASFVKKLEKQVGCALQYRPQGRPRRDIKG